MWTREWQEQPVKCFHCNEGTSNRTIGFYAGYYIKSASKQNNRTQRGHIPHSQGKQQIHRAEKLLEHVITIPLSCMAIDVNRHCGVRQTN